MAFHFAWVNASETSFTAEFQREDEDIVAFEVEHQEGDFATLRLLVRNPRIGLLNVGRKRWAWFAVDATPLFFGRLVGLPDDINEDVVSLTFIARPMNYQAAREAVAATMRQTQYFDPLFIDEQRRLEADTVLEARPMVWCIDRVTHAITASHIAVGEAGVIDFGGDAFEESVQCSFSGQPQTKILIEASVSWTQCGFGSLTVPFRNIETYTGDGLLSDWPKAGANIGGGWKVSASFARDRWTRLNNTTISQAGSTYRLYRWQIRGSVDLTYEAERSCREIVTFTMATDLQEIMTEAGDEEPITMSVSGAADEPVDAGGAMPIGDVRRRSYFATDRAAQSVAYLANVAAARLTASARCVDIGFEVPFTYAASLSLRHSGRIADARLPGGEATGKIRSYRISGSGESGAFVCGVTIACTPGTGEIAAVSAGAPDYVENGYADAYQTATGATTTVVTDPVTGEPAMTVTSFAGFEVNDDGLDLFNMTLANCLLEKSVSKAADWQYNNCIWPRLGDTNTSLSDNPTRVKIRMRPVNGGPFETAIDITCSDLKLPKTIDLEAAPS